ncbi:hypothetical protein R1flu_027119 [Riccia fluitans]|uniref:Uncharacterized protein n=1 Tax=Riccia fluitans TaxID=41844 RepID=A0ABD1XKY2_9MARC
MNKPQPSQPQSQQTLLALKNNSSLRWGDETVRRWVVRTSPWGTAGETWSQTANWLSTHRWGILIVGIRAASERRRLGRQLEK